MEIVGAASISIFISKKPAPWPLLKRRLDSLPKVRLAPVLRKKKRDEREKTTGSFLASKLSGNDFN